jgi:hypothetical protein
VQFGAVRTGTAGPVGRCVVVAGFAGALGASFGAVTVICGIAVASLGGVAFGAALSCVCVAGAFPGETGGGAFGS